MPQFRVRRISLLFCGTDSPTPLPWLDVGTWGSNAVSLTSKERLDNAIQIAICAADRANDSCHRVAVVELRVGAVYSPSHSWQLRATAHIYGSHRHKCPGSTCESNMVRSGSLALGQRIAGFRRWHFVVLGCIEY